MMRNTATMIMVICLTTPLAAQTQGSVRRGSIRQGTANQRPQAQVASRAQAGQNQAVAPNAGGAPFPALSAAAQQQLDETLRAWEKKSNETKTLDVEFVRFHYDSAMAAANVPARKALGTIKYAAPDRGLIKVDTLVFFDGVVAGQPTYKSFKDRFGEHWVCNGKQLIEFDYNQKECKIEDLPVAMQGTNIISSPLPFVFNLNVDQMKQRYWVRQTQTPDPNVIVLEVWPKRAGDRSQYKMVQVALSRKTFQPAALVMYAPNFDAKTAPVWDHYEFKSVKRNQIGDRMLTWANHFIPEKPPGDWKILRTDFIPENGAEAQVASPNHAGQQRLNRQNPGLTR